MLRWENAPPVFFKQAICIPGEIFFQKKYNDSFWAPRESMLECALYKLNANKNEIKSLVNIYFYVYFVSMNVCVGARVRVLFFCSCCKSDPTNHQLDNTAFHAPPPAFFRPDHRNYAFIGAGSAVYYTEGTTRGVRQSSGEEKRFTDFLGLRPVGERNARDKHFNVYGRGVKSFESSRTLFRERGASDVTCSKREGRIPLSSSTETLSPGRN